VLRSWRLPRDLFASFGALALGEHRHHFIDKQAQCLLLQFERQVEGQAQAILVDAGVITGYRAEIDPRRLGYDLTAIVRIKPAPGQLSRIPELAAEISEVGECHRITGEDCFFLKVHLRSIDELGALLDRFLIYGETTTSLINASPIPRRDPPLRGD
jgi:hypothetical protein